MAGENERLIVLDILLEVLEKKNFLHLVTRQAMSKFDYLPSSKKAFIKRLAYGVTERMLYLDAVIDRVSSVPVKKQKPVIRNILRMSAYQARFMDVPAHAVCSEAVILAKKKGFSGLQGFVNAVSRKLVSAEKEDTLWLAETGACAFSCPEWLYEFLLGYYPESSVRALLSHEQKEDSAVIVHLHTNIAKKEDILASLLADGVTAEPLTGIHDGYRLSPGDSIPYLEAYKNGWFQVQGASSILACQCADVRPGMDCLDLCAAPGGKSIYLAHALNGSGRVVSRDISEPRLSFLRESIERTGLSSIETEAADASVFRPEDENAYDLVLADVPCSGLGVLRKKPDIKYRLSPDELKKLVLLQRAILAQAQKYVKKGGILLYCTCTADPEENERQVEWLLSGGRFVPDLTAPSLNGGLKGTASPDRWLQLFPSEIFMNDGFFISRLRRK